jgi:uncharacterized protein YidB (DUF937 family)
MASNQMLALLGLLAVAGYQNRDKLGEMFGKMTGADGSSPSVPGGATESPLGGLGNILGGLGGLLGGSSRGEAVSGGLGELLDRFRNTGHGEAASSWVETGPNRDLTAGQLEEALGADTVAALTEKTGLSRAELISRLQAVLPSAVDKLTPDGRVPTSDEASRLISA